MSFLTDEHVPRVFISTLRSNGHEVVRAKEIFGEATVDRDLLEYCADEDHILVSHDRKDFSGHIAENIDHAGIVLYTDPNFLRDEPEAAARLLERILSHYDATTREGELIWLDQWR